MKKLFVIRKGNDLSQFKNIRIVKLMMLSHTIIELKSKIEIYDDYCNIYFSSYPKYDKRVYAYDVKFMALMPIVEWCLDGVLTAQTDITDGELQMPMEEITKNAISAFTMINIFADRNYDSAKSFNEIIRKFSDAINAWKKTAHERESKWLNHDQIDYICKSVTEMLKRYKLYAEYKSGNLMNKYYFDEEVMHDWLLYATISPYGQLSEKQVFAFESIEDKIMDNPFLLLDIFKYFGSTNDTTEYCKRYLVGRDKNISNLVFDYAEYIFRLGDKK